MGRGRRFAPQTVEVLLAGSVVALAVVAALIVLRRPGGPGWRAVDDLAQVLAPLTATVSAAWAAREAAGRLRRTWVLAAAGCSCWALAQLYWTAFDLDGRQLDFFSLADAGYVLMPLLLVWAVVMFPTRRGSRSIWVLDGLTAVVALLALSWATILPSVLAADDNRHLDSLATAVLYPVFGVLAMAVVAQKVVQETDRSRSLLLLGVGIVTMAAANSWYAVQSARGSYRTGNVVDAMWISAFLLIGLAAVASRRRERARHLPPGHPARGASFVPYLPISVTTAVIERQMLGGWRPDVGELGLVALLVSLMLVRQWLNGLENRRLAAVVAERDEELQAQALQDPLTGLGNRRLFVDRLTRALTAHGRESKPLGVLFCDLDDFKGVNDTLGHLAGDQLLVWVAGRMRATVRSGDTLVRLGGDEFAVLLADGGDADAVADRLVRAVHEPVDLDGVQISPRISVGVTVVGPGPAAPTLPTLLSQADIAMYAAKRAGKGRTVVYHGGMTLPESADLLLSEPLRQALALGEVHPHFQPIVEVGTGQVRGFEALVRWPHRGQWVPAADLVAVANRTGQMAALTATMLDQACSTLAQVVRDTGQRRLFVTVNVSPSQVVDPTFPAQVRAAVQRHGLAPRDLVIEITEEGLLGDLAAARTVTSELHEDGFALALDDFGTGYSSLAHLHDIPLSILKIDRAFVVRLGQDPRSEIFLQAVRHLGEDLGLSVMVEGVETEEQAVILDALGIELAQGFLYAAALPAAELTAFVAAGGAALLVALASPPRP